MLYLLALIALAAANPCPYCKWDACSFTDGSIASCSECNDIAGLVPVRITGASPLDEIGVCQLCPNYCKRCEYALKRPFSNNPIPALTCVDCNYGYTTNPENGQCTKCPNHCSSCICTKLGCEFPCCDACEPGYTLQKRANGEGRECV